MGIDAYISNQTIQKWFNAVIKELDFLDDCTLHKNLDALYNSLLHVKNSRVVLIDIEDKASIDYFLSIKNGFDNISCVAIGLNKNITESFVYFNFGEVESFVFGIFAPFILEYAIKKVFWQIKWWG